MSCAAFSAARRLPVESWTTNKGHCSKTPLHEGRNSPLRGPNPVERSSDVPVRVEGPKPINELVSVLLREMVPMTASGTYIRAVEVAEQRRDFRPRPTPIRIVMSDEDLLRLGIVFDVDRIRRAVALAVE